MPTVVFIMWLRLFHVHFIVDSLMPMSLSIFASLDVTHPMGMNQRTAFRYLRDVNVCWGG